MMLEIYDSEARLFCQGSSSLYLFICFFQEVSFIAACIASDCPLILCFIVHCELSTTGIQEPLRAQHPFCCSCPQPAEFTGVLWFMVYLLPERGFLWVLFYLFLLLFLVCFVVGFLVPVLRSGVNVLVWAGQEKVVVVGNSYT